jgi:hypothetical protein
MDDLFIYYVMGRRRIPPNRFGGKLFPYNNIDYDIRLIKSYYLPIKEN